MKDITKDLKKNAKIKILGFSLPIFGLISFILMLQLYFDYKPDCPPKISTVKGFPTWHTLITPLLMTMLISDLLVFIGKKTPILKDIGGGSILCILLPSFLLTYKFSENPAIKNLQDIVSNNMKSFNSGKGIGFPNFVVSAIIVGSFVNMDLKLLKKSFKKFFPLVLMSLMIGFFIIGFLGIIFEPIKGIKGEATTTYSPFFDAIYYIFVPLTSGGMTAGIAPLTQVYSSLYKPEIKGFMDHIYPALLVGGVFSICLAGLIKKILDGTKYDGKGALEILDVSSKNKLEYNSFSFNKKTTPIEYSNIQTGLILIFTLYSASSLIWLLFKKIDKIKLYVPANIVFLVLIIIGLKFLNVITEHYNKCIQQASKMITTNFVSPLLVILGATLDFNKIINRMIDFKFLFVCCFSVALVALFAGVIGKKMGFYSLEASLSAGLCTNSIGGSGNICILSAADRMELMPFAQIATRLGGAFIVLVSSITYPIFYGG